MVRGNTDCVACVFFVASDCFMGAATPSEGCRCGLFEARARYGFRSELGDNAPREPDWAQSPVPAFGASGGVTW